MCSLLEISLQPFEKFETKKKKKDRLPLWKEFICVRQIIRKGFITLKWLVSIFANAWVKKLKVLNFIYFRLLPPSASRWQCLHSMINVFLFYLFNFSQKYKVIENVLMQDHTPPDWLITDQIRFFCNSYIEVPVKSKANKCTNNPLFTRRALLKHTFLTKAALAVTRSSLEWL